MERDGDLMNVHGKLAPDSGHGQQAARKELQIIVKRHTRARWIDGASIATAMHTALVATNFGVVGVERRSVCKVVGGSSRAHWWTNLRQ